MMTTIFACTSAESVSFQKKLSKKIMIWINSVFCFQLRCSFPCTSLYCVCVGFLFLFYFGSCWFCRTTNGSSRRRVVTVSDLRAVLKAKTKRKTTQRRRDLIIQRSSALGSDLSEKHKLKKKNPTKTDWELFFFLFVCDLEAFQEESLFACCERAKATLLWPYKAITAANIVCVGGRGWKCIILQYSQINIAKHGFILLVQNL